MSTLADINKALQNQTSVLEDVASSTASTNSNLDRFIRAMQRKQDGDDLEAEREKGRARLFQSQQQKSSDRPAPKSGMFDNIQFPAGILTAAGLSQFGKSLLKGGLLRAVPIALATAFADDIESWVTSETGSKEIGEAASRASIGGAFGLALGKRFGALGAIIGAVATKDNIEKFNDLSTALKEKINGFLESVGTFTESDAAKGIRDTFEKLGIDITAIKNGLPSMETVLTSLSTIVGDALVAITGFVNEGFDSKEFQDNWMQGVGLIGGLVLVLKPLRKVVFGLTKILAKSKIAQLVLAVGLGTKAISDIMEDGEINEDDFTSAMGLALGAGAVAAYGASKMRGRNNARTGTQAGAAAAAGAVTKPNNFAGKLNGRDVVISKSGNYSFAGADGKATTQMLSEAEVKQLNKGKWWQKFPRIKGLRYGPLAAVFALLDGFLVSRVMADESLTKDQKISEVGDILGTSAGGLLGAGAGFLVGGPLGSILGGFAGSYLGSAIGAKFAEWLFGGDNNAPPGYEGIVSPMGNLQGAGMGSYDFAFDDTSSPSVSRPKVSSGVAENQAMSSYYSNLAGAGMGSYGDTNIGQVGDNPTYNTQSSPIVMTPGGAIKLSDIVTE